MNDYTELVKELLDENADINETIPPTIRKAAAAIETLQAELAAATTLAAERLDQMNTDRKQAMTWRDQVAAANAKLESISAKLEAICELVLLE